MPYEQTSSLDRLIQSDEPVRLVSFSADGQTLAGACRDGKVRLWETASGKLLRTVALGPEDRRSITLPPGARWVAAAGPDKVIEIWSLANGELLHRLAGHTQPTGALAFSRDGKMLASSSAGERAVRLWDLESAKQRFILPDGFGGAANLVFSPDGELLVGANYDTNLRVWSTRTGALLRTIEDLLVSIFASSFSPDGIYLACAGVDRTVYVWNTRNWTVTRKLTGQPEMISAMTFSPDGRLLVTGGTDASSFQNPAKILVWEMGSGTVLRTLSTAHGVTSIAMSPDSRVVAFADARNAITLASVPEAGISKAITQ